MMFSLSKLLWALAAPSSLLLLLLGCGIILQHAQAPKRIRYGRCLCVVAGFCFLLIAVFPVGSWALAPLENRFALKLPDFVEGIVMLGGDERSDISSARQVPTALDSMRRYAGFAQMARLYPDAKLVFAGGSVSRSPDPALNEAGIARQILSLIGTPIARVTFEKESRNTYENAVFAARLAQPDPHKKWLLVTSAYHMPRAVGCFRSAGWDVVPVPTGYFTTGHPSFFPVFRFDEQMHLLTYAMHEYMGLIAYRIMGRIDALWPG